MHHKPSARRVYQQCNYAMTSVQLDDNTVYKCAQFNISLHNKLHAV